MKLSATHTSELTECFLCNGQGRLRPVADAKEGEVCGRCEGKGECYIMVTRISPEMDENGKEIYFGPAKHLEIGQTVYSVLTCEGGFRVTGPNEVVSFGPGVNEEGTSGSGIVYVMEYSIGKGRGSDYGRGSNYIDRRIQRQLFETEEMAQEWARIFTDQRQTNRRENAKRREEQP